MGLMNIGDGMDFITDRGGGGGMAPKGGRPAGKQEIQCRMRASRGKCRWP